MTFLPNAFAVFSPFSVISRYLYSAYVLLIISSLAFSCVHLLPNKCASPLSMTLFKHSRFLRCSLPPYGVSKMSPKKSSSFNIFPASVIAFISCLSLHHMKNNIRHKGSTASTFVIIFLIGSQLKHSQRWYFAWENPQGSFCDFGSFIFVLHFVVVVLHPFLFFICCCSSFIAF